MLATAHAQEALGHGTRVLPRAGRRGHVVGQTGEPGLDRRSVQALVAAGTENRREVRGLHLANADIGVGDGQRPAAAVAGRAGVGARAVGADADARAVEVQDAAAPGRDGVDRHHRRAHPHPGHLGLEGAFKDAIVQRDIGAGAAHVEADDAAQPGHPSRARRADDAAGGPDKMASLPPNWSAAARPPLLCMKYSATPGNSAATWST